MNSRNIIGENSHVVLFLTRERKEYFIICIEKKLLSNHILTVLWLLAIYNPTTEFWSQKYLVLSKYDWWMILTQVINFFYRIYVIMWPAYSGHKYKKCIRFFQTCCFGWHFGRIIIRHALWHLFSHIVEPLRSWNTALSVCPWQEWYKIWEKTVITRFQ